MTAKRAETYKVLEPIMFRQRVFKAGRIVTFNAKNAEKYVDAGKMMKVDMRGFTNILNCGLQFPSEVVLLGSGPNGLPKHPMLAGKFIIALNEAIYADVDVSVWGAQDPLLKSEKWFTAMAMKLQNSGRKFDKAAFNRGEFPMPIVERHSIAKHNPWFKLTFSVSKPALDPANIDIDSPLLHTQGTVCGTFLQICNKLMIVPEPPLVRRIILCGIDMFGNKYFNKTLHRDKARKGKTWYRTRQLDALIKGLIDSGIEVVTVSETRLRNPVFVEKI